MFKVEVTNNTTSKTFSATFSTVEEADAWITLQTSKSGWGNIEDCTVNIINITDQINQQQVNSEARELLSSTDWKIIRHIGQRSLNITTSLTEQEYLDLETERQSARNSIVE